MTHTHVCTGSLWGYLITEQGRDKQNGGAFMCTAGTAYEGATPDGVYIGSGYQGQQNPHYYYGSRVLATGLS